MIGLFTVMLSLDSVSDGSNKASDGLYSGY